MSLQLDQVKKIAKLANLSLTDKEAAKLEAELNETLKFIQNLDQVEIKNAEPTYQVTGLFNVMRPDEVAPSLTQNQALANAPAKEDGYFKVKAVFADES